MMYRLLNLLLGLAGAFAAIIIYDRITFDPTIPVERWVGVEVLNSPIKAGEDLHIIIKRKKVRDDCPVSSSRQVINDDGVSYNLTDEVWSGGEVDVDYIEYAYPTPNNLPEGNYTLRVFLTYNCPDFVWTTQQPDARFRVVKE